MGVFAPASSCIRRPRTRECLAASEHNAGVAFINSQGNYLQVFGDGVKVTKDAKERAAWP